MSDADILTRAAEILLRLAGKPGQDYDYLMSASAATCALAAHDLTSD